MKFMCWEADHLEEEAIEIDDVADAEDAARTACERWNDSGAWDSTPHVINVRVRGEDGVPWLVEVETSWEVSFWGAAPKAQPLADIEDLENFMATNETWGPKLARFSALMGMKYEAMTNAERHERYLLKEKLERAGFDPSWRPG
jgi:hypothetical protein